MDLFAKLKILSAAARYDVSCASSGSTRTHADGGMGNTVSAGVCHSWSGDGRCISLLKVLFSNACIYNCAYCLNRLSNDCPRTSFTVDELVSVTMSFYRRNYIEGLFLSSGILGSPDYTMKKLLNVAKILRNEHHFRGYIHLKIIPGVHPRLIQEAGLYADRMSVNIELPSESSLSLLAPQKHKEDIFSAMNTVDTQLKQSEEDKKRMRSVPSFAPAGQSTQLIIGASPETDYHILTLTDNLYRCYHLKRVYFSAYVPLNNDPLLSTAQGSLVREHRLYQADWLIRFYQFTPEEIVCEDTPNLDPDIDPKLTWALRHLHLFPVEINRANPEMLVRIPGIGMQSAKKILHVRKRSTLDFDLLKKLRISLKKAQYFMSCKGKMLVSRDLSAETIKKRITQNTSAYKQLWLDL